MSLRTCYAQNGICWHFDLVGNEIVMRKVKVCCFGRVVDIHIEVWHEYDASLFASFSRNKSNAGVRPLWYYEYSITPISMTPICSVLVCEIYS